MRTLLRAIIILLATASPASAITGGHRVQDGAYPFAVRLVTNGNTPEEGGFCAGTLISPNAVITAAHCVVDNIPGAKGRHYAPPRDINIYAGSAFLGTAELVHSKAIIVHPEYDKPRNRFDAAIIILDQPVTAHWVPLAASTLPAGSSASIAGWGAMDAWGAGHPVYLRSANVKIRTLTDCRRGDPHLGGITFWPESMLCANAPGRDSCEYDSGGPLVGYVDGQLSLVGITSYGAGCGDENMPGIYTRVTAIRAWALGVVRDHA